MSSEVIEEDRDESTVMEECERVGGRVKIGMVESYHLDHCFQVLLTVCSMLRICLDIEFLKGTPFTLVSNEIRIC